ncbi:unnamed protein product [Acanthoscelides obtectus]|uniref:Uncharacterized protein n=1 Tax=Acanthoscelides obtectus TaxID=200917 RepID=A0A9P0L390_ACAOB|nr:unnamed protein product [Acanthoscelides obtectus]CAH1973113.1 unnamed protein product [Acanthoscelides obtectus]CAH1986996.1 unnamed protein product [Acanthoscelides obtectus]CAH1992764.1 unnamed protein product [Acanthoscelides obtectus]CAK1624882.1 hypothetical protein AOBTE_LOCUS2821 [Acanthoscelides obtectus]
MTNWTKHNVEVATKTNKNTPEVIIGTSEIIEIVEKECEHPRECCEKKVLVQQRAKHQIQIHAMMDSNFSQIKRGNDLRGRQD